MEKTLILERDALILEREAHLDFWMIILFISENNFFLFIDFQNSILIYMFCLVSLLLVSSMNFIIIIKFI